MIMQLLMGINGLLWLWLIWSLREFWQEHKAQHARMILAVEKIDEVYASKASVCRAHNRLDAVEREQKEHKEQLTRIETTLRLTAWKKRAACPPAADEEQ